MLKLRLIAIALLIACTAAPISAGAEPLEREECKALEAEKRTMLTPRIKTALQHGPDWVKEHLHNQAEIEKIRQYLQVEEKVAFRCRTDGVRIPKPLPPPLPDRKPAVPTILVEGTPKILAGVAATSFLPLRKPSVFGGETPGAETAGAEPPADEETAGEGDITTPADTEAEAGPSQTVADSDKTAPSEEKATQ